MRRTYGSVNSAGGGRSEQEPGRRRRAGGGWVGGAGPGSCPPGPMPVDGGEARLPGSGPDRSEQGGSTRDDAGSDGRARVARPRLAGPEAASPAVVGGAGLQVGVLGNVGWDLGTALLAAILSKLLVLLWRRLHRHLSLERWNLPDAIPDPDPPPEPPEPFPEELSVTEKIRWLEDRRREARDGLEDARRAGGGRRGQSARYG